MMKALKVLEAASKAELMKTEDDAADFDGVKFL
jgi:hypothetical protein